MGVGKAALWGAFSALLIVAVVVSGIVVLGNGDAAMMSRPGDRVMIVVATHRGQDPGLGAALVGIVDSSGTSPRVTLLDPSTTVTIPGTSASTLRDSYAYGGPAGVSRAWARAGNALPLPVVGVGETALLTLVARCGPVTVDVPGDQNVFDGTRLFTFERGRHELAGPQLVALLSAADFAGGAEGMRIRQAVAEGIVAALSSADPAMTDLVRARRIVSTLSIDDLRTWAGKLRPGMSGATIATGAR